MQSARTRAATLAVTLAALWVAPAHASRDDFSVWLEALRAEAHERGISEATISASLTGVEPLGRVIELDRNQPGAPAGFCEYVRTRLTESRIERGRRMLGAHRTVLRAIGRKYGVPPRFLIALWGLETNFGDYTGDYRVIDSLATLAHDDRRGPMFRRQLFAALRIVDEGHQKPARMKGSWAGAMGQVQFMPTTFLSYAVDHDGDGRKDVWGSLPDAFASAAHYLRSSGWKPGETWGREVRLPSALASDRAARKKRRPLADWQAAGVRRIDGSNLPRADLSGVIVLPSGRASEAFLVYNNFDVLLRWNHSTAFGITVGSLADELTATASMRSCRTQGSGRSR